ncbi:MAG: hypothetical protein IPM51_07515 [Sphingobacteriaceae bacterium]|nr:hypothetical protein [Sphingobacteriaceae bacterium]
MNKRKIIFSVLAILAGFFMSAQETTYDDMNIDIDSLSKAYTPTAKKYVYVKSKKGSDGMPKDPAVDAILKQTVTDIVLVFSEYDNDDMEKREDNNRERWENLLATYPGLFQFSTAYLNMCQYTRSGENEAFKKAQGFYIYYEADPTAKAEVKKVEEPVVQTPVKTPEKVKEEKSKPKENTVKETKAEEPKKVDTKKEEKTEEKVVKNTEPVKVPHHNEEDDGGEYDGHGPETTHTASDAELKASKPKKAIPNKPRRAKDPKACRPPFYENGDDDLNEFFKNNITLSKKQKRHGKHLLALIRIQINYDGSIKKIMVTGTDQILNAQLTAAVKMMNAWNPAVKGGVTCKSEVKLTMKYDKASKAMKPFETMIVPRPGPKCKIVSDSELFDD